MAQAVRVEQQPVKFGERTAPVLKTSALQWQSEGFVWREAFVRLPNGMTLQDLNDSPAIWENIQANAATALRQFDRIRAVAYDQAWIVDATVSFADRKQVLFAGIRKTDMPKRSVALFENEDYRVDWAGSGYAVIRKSDGVVMGSQTYSVPDQARAALLQLYPSRVS